MTSLTILVDERGNTEYNLKFCGKTYRQSTTELEDGSTFYSNTLAELIEADLGEMIRSALDKDKADDLRYMLQEISDNDTVGMIAANIEILTECEQEILGGAEYVRK